MNIPFELPAAEKYGESPKWDGQAFVFDGKRTAVLEYSENFAGWSDALTALHEEAAGGEHPVDLASRNDALEQVKKFISSPEVVVLEIGCSSGFFIRDLATTLPEAVIIGADVVKEPLYRLARSLSGIPLIRFDLLKCPLPDQSIDLIVMLNVLEHIDDDVAALKNAFNLLKPGGGLVIEVPAGPHLYDAYDAQLCHFRRYSSAELKQKLGEAGFGVLRQSHLGFLLFPAFVVVKLLNKSFLFRKRTSIVRDQAKTTSKNFFVRWAMNVESKFLMNLSLPWGIRALAVARRPE